MKLQPGQNGIDYQVYIKYTNLKLLNGNQKRDFYEKREKNAWNNPGTGHIFDASWMWK